MWDKGARCDVARVEGRCCAELPCPVPLVPLRRLRVASAQLSRTRAHLGGSPARGDGDGGGVNGRRHKVLNSVWGLRVCPGQEEKGRED